MKNILYALSSLILFTGSLYGSFTDERLYLSMIMAALGVINLIHASFGE